MAREKLIETFQGSWGERAPIRRLPLNESTKIIEKNGTKYEVLGAYKVPVWRLDKKNLNDRVYSTKLAEKVCKENKVTLACDSHVENPTYEDVKAVGKNPVIEKGILWAEAYMVDEEFNKKVERIIEAGAGVGLSSSAWGDQDKDGNILEEGFEIERYFDFVLDPSYEVFLTSESRMTEEALETEKQLSEENATNKIENSDKSEMKTKSTETNPMEKTLTTIEEKNLKLGVKSLLEKAEVKTHPKDKLAVFNEAIEYLDGVECDFAKEMTEEIEKKISEVNDLLSESYDKAQEVLPKMQESEKTLSEKDELLKEAELKLESLTMKYETALEMIEDMKTRELKLKEMYDYLQAEKNGMVSAKDLNEMTKYIESLESQTQKLEAINRALKKRLEAAPKATKVAKAKISPIEESDYEMDPEEDDEEEMEIEEAIRRGYEGFEYESLVTEDYKDIDGVTRYYENLLSENKNVSKIKSEIMKCKTVVEAQKTYMNLQDLIEGPKAVRIKQVEAKYREPSVSKLRRQGWV